MAGKTYIAIDLKSFYASVECAERGLDPLDANLIVADEVRTDKTICLAVSPTLKSIGLPGRPRLFEVRQRVADYNRERRRRAPGRQFTGKSVFMSELRKDPSRELDFVIARPRMAYYMDYSRCIVEIYLRYVSMDDLLPYSIDEVFIDATAYLPARKMNAHDFAMLLIRQVLRETRITATAGIGTNMYLAKIAMDIMAKRSPADKDGVRIAQLDELSYREQLWTHRPLTDFWRVGRGTARRLEKEKIFTMGDIARCSAGRPGDYYSEDLLYKLFGVNAELLIDHAWGWESAEIADCKAYKPESKSLSSGQVLSRPYSFDEGRIVIMEMADSLSLELVRAGLLTDQVVLYVGYDIENLTDPKRAARYRGPVTTDHYGRQVPKSAHGSRNLGLQTSSTAKIMEAVAALYDSIADKNLLVHRFNLAVMHLIDESEAEPYVPEAEQLDLFTDYEALEREREAQKAELEREKRKQKALIGIKDKYGKNSIVKGLNMQEGSTGMERSRQIGGHKA